MTVDPLPGTHSRSRSNDLFGLSSTVSYQTCRMADLAIDTFIDLETQVWNALAEGNPGADSELLAADFLGVYPTGFVCRDDHVGQLVHGPTVTSFALHDAQLLVVSNSSVLLAYRAEFTRPATSERVETMYVTSLWCARDGRWVNVFSQDSPCPSASG